MNEPTRDDDAVIAVMPDLVIEVSHREDMLIVEQRDFAGEVDRIALHRCHVRMLAEEMGLLPAPSPRRNVVKTLVRRLRALHDRIEELDEYLHKYSDTEHADMQWELTYSRATWSISQEFLEDLGDIGVPEPEVPSVQRRVPDAAPARSHVVLPLAKKESDAVPAPPTSAALPSGGTKQQTLM